MKVHLVRGDKDESWILGKFAQKLRDELLAEGLSCEISSKSDPRANVNHYVSRKYYARNEKNDGITTILVTHINTDHKLAYLRSQLIDADIGVCMSTETVEKLVQQGIPRSKLCFITPGHDSAIRPRKIVIGITTKIY